MHGLRVLGTAGTQAGLDLVKSQGAEHVFNHREENYIEKIRAVCPDGIDLILEMLANANLNNDLKLLKYKKGRVGVRVLLLSLSFSCFNQFFFCLISDYWK